MGKPSLGAQLGEFFRDDPLYAVALAAALLAFATTPVAFAVLGRMDWFRARRGRTTQKPEFSSIIVGMMLVMGIPAIFAALLVKSRYFDKDRYEFDPNRTISVLDQGRQFESLNYRESLYKADEAVRAEMKRLAEERKNLVDNVKKLDEAMLAMRAASAQSPATAQAIPAVLERLAGVRKSVGIDGPQQLMDFTAPPASLPAAPTVIAGSPAAAPASIPAPAAPVHGLAPTEREVELAKVPDPQRELAAMLPLSDLPPGWEVGKNMGPNGNARLETFNADNLFEKIDGRAESFVQYDVKGMAYTFYHPAGDDSTEAQLYIFEMADPLKALGKYGSEKPAGVESLDLGSEGYAAAGSTFFHAGRYYTQIVSTSDDPKLATFAMELAKRVAAKQKSAASTSVAGADAPADPAELLKLLPDQPGKKNPKYVAQDVFGYSFLSDVFMADYAEGDSTWQGFLRPYASADEADQILDKYADTAKADGATIKEVEGTGADRFLIASNPDIGLTDILFRKGNTVAGANGAVQPEPAEQFARTFAGTLPGKVPTIAIEKTTPAGGGEGGGED